MENYGYHRPFFAKNQHIFLKSGDKMNKMVFFGNLMNFIGKGVEFVDIILLKR